MAGNFRRIPGKLIIDWLWWVIFRVADGPTAVSRSCPNRCWEERIGLAEGDFGRRVHRLILKMADFFALIANLGQGIDADLKVDL